MRVRLNTLEFERQIDNLVEYSLGFLEGAESGKKIFLDNLGKGTVEALKLYIDAMARSNPQSLHHVYEWSKTGSRDARLFDVQYRITNLGLSIDSNFRQSTSVQSGSYEPFYNKAKIMENGIPVVIRPKKNSVLRFYEGGETVFTSKPVTVRNPGGNQVEGSFERIFDEFMTRYFTQAFLRASGISDYISNPVIYKKNLPAGAKQGRPKGVSTGYKWITNAKIEVE